MLTITPTELPDVKIIEVKYFEDERGFLTENYNKQRFDDHGLAFNFVQDFHSMSKQAGVLRGMHFQREPRAQNKLIRVTQGSIFDVVVDIRIGSPTYGKWTSVILSKENHLQLLVPVGFAHGFCTLTDHTEVMYKVDDEFSAENYCGILWNDQDLGIEWPKLERDWIISEKDQKLPRLKDYQNTFHY